MDLSRVQPAPVLALGIVVGYFLLRLLADGQVIHALQDLLAAILKLLVLVASFGRVNLAQSLTAFPISGLVFSSRHYTGTAKAYGLTQEFTTP